MEYHVEQGDCLFSIAQNHNMFWQTLWDHSRNATLRELRKNPNVLCEGDTVFVPDKEEKTLDIATEQRHRFRRKGVPFRIRLCLLKESEPRANVRYVFTLDNKHYEGMTDDDGYIEIMVPRTSVQGELTLYENEEEEKYNLTLGHLDPVDTLTGVQQRLRNLGFPCEVSGTMDQGTKIAITGFREKHGPKGSEDIDDPLRQRLLELHSS